MEIIIPNQIELGYTYSTDPSIFANWSSSTAYSKGQRVFDTADGNDYEAEEDIPAGKSRPSQNKDWKKLRSTVAYDVETYLTDADISEYNTFVLDQGWSSVARFWDPSDGNDYVWDNIVVGNTDVYADYYPSASPYAQFWTKIGKGNAFRMFDPQVIEKTAADSSLTCTAWTTGLADRIALYGLENVKDVSITVTAGEKLRNPDFISSAWHGWYAVSGTLSHTTSQLNTNGAVAILVPHVVGRSYTFSVDANIGSGETLTISVKTGDGATVVATGSTLTTGTNQTDDLSYTATEPVQMLVMTATGGTVQVNDVSCTESGFTTENLSADMSYSEDDLSYASSVKLAHELVDSPQYVITLESEYSSTEIKCGYVCSGKGVYVAATHVDVDRDLEDYSYISFNKDYGTGEFLQRGYRDQYRVVLHIPSTTGPWVDWFLRRLRAVPVGVDMAQQDTTGTPAVADDGLLTFGLIANPNRTITGLPDLDQITLTIEALVNETQPVVTA